MDVLVVGSGAREHALYRALTADSAVESVVVAPGNAGIPAGRRRPVDPASPRSVADLAAAIRADLVVVGPEAPLVAGVADAVRERGIACFGPSAEAARIEGSKAFAKEVMAAAGVPTALARLCTTTDQVDVALAAFGPPFVVKDDGLAGGKGVVVTDDEAAARAHATSCLARPGGRVVVERYLEGPEVSLFCVTDGVTVVPLAPAQDFKRVGDGDVGPNTGGMGAYSPLPWAPPALAQEVAERIAGPVVTELARRGTPFAGVLYCGLALTPQGVRVIEFNARFGDPETQVVLARLATPLGTLVHAAATGRLHLAPLPRWRREAAVTVVIAAEGYPSAPVAGDVVEGLTEAEAVPGAYVLHAGTDRDSAGRVVTTGGRVLSVVGTGPDLAAARATAYEAVERIRMRGGHYRRDICAAAAAPALRT
ncbi:MAG TPA: phosphoribosylamine--glycine ligase [Kineosporiaceae bacterium]|nr:phosphoribosylamine--glycine ligase [Kineosporiaceae bacterium]